MELLEKYINILSQHEDYNTEIPKEERINYEERIDYDERFREEEREQIGP